MAAPGQGPGSARCETSPLQCTGNGAFIAPAIQAQRCKRCCMPSTRHPPRRPARHGRRRDSADRRRRASWPAGRGAAMRAAAQLRFAFEKVGFYYLAGHGVPQSLVDTAYAEAARFHAQPIDRKLALKVDEHNIGYMPIAQQAAAQRRRPGQEAEPERGLFPAPRTRPRRSRRALRAPFPRHEQVARRKTTCRVSAPTCWPT